MENKTFATINVCLELYLKIKSLMNFKNYESITWRDKNYSKEIKIKQFLKIRIALQ